MRGASRRGRKTGERSLLRFLLGVALLAWVLRSFIVQPFYIPSASMLPSLYVGDYLFVAKWPYGFSRYSFPLAIPAFKGRLFAALPKRGDVVVFQHPAEGSDLIKRVIGLPGDIVELRGGRLILNGHPVARRPADEARIPLSPNSPCRVAPGAIAKVESSGSFRECAYKAYLESLPGGPSYTVLSEFNDGPADNFPATRVPPGRLFLMGDNRDDSLDSRFPTSEGGVGMLPVEDLVGRALFNFWSTDGSASYVKPFTWFSALRPQRIGRTYTASAK